MLANETRNYSTFDYELLGADLAGQILSLKERPTGIVFYNDARAFGGMKALLAMGFSIPGDFSVASFDNVPMAGLMTPGLTSVDLGYKRAAAHAVRAVIECGAPEETHVEPVLAGRQSVREAPQKEGLA